MPLVLQIVAIVSKLICPNNLGEVGRETTRSITRIIPPTTMVTKLPGLIWGVKHGLAKEK